MPEKKLVTLAAVAGILVCGGCFASNSKPAPQPPPAPAPSADGLRDGIERLHTIAVKVTNSSDSQHIAPADLAQAVITHIDRFKYPFGLSAEPATDSSKADAVLAIHVLSESASPRDAASARPTWWNFDTRLSASLTTRDGTILWQEIYEDHDLSIALKKKNAADAWKAAQSHDWPEIGLALHVVDRMLHPRNPSTSP